MDTPRREEGRVDRERTGKELAEQPGRRVGAARRSGRVYTASIAAATATAKRRAQRGRTERGKGKAGNQNGGTRAAKPSRLTSSGKGAIRCSRGRW